MRLRGWLVYQEESLRLNGWFARRLIERASEHGLHLEVKSIDALSLGLHHGCPQIHEHAAPLSFPDFAIMRVAYPFASEFFEFAGVRVFNSYAVSKLCNNKSETFLQVSKYCPEILDVNFYDRRFQRETMLFPNGSVIKSIDGHGGAEVDLVSCHAEVFELVSQYAEPGYLIQRRFHAPGDDVRVYIVGNEPVCAVKRIANGLKSNYSLGGQVERYQLAPNERDAVSRIVNGLDCAFDFVGIDFLVSDKGFVFNEIEDVVGSRMLYKTWDIDIADIYMEYVQAAMRTERSENGSE